MDQNSLRDLLTRLSKGETTVEECLDRLKRLPFEDLGFACIDHHRSLRRGLSEVVFGEGKEVTEILAIMEQMLRPEDPVANASSIIPNLKDHFPKLSIRLSTA